MDIRFAQAEILRLLDVIPGLTFEGSTDIRESVKVGEVQLALETLCSWVVKDQIPISSSTLEALTTLADQMEIAIPLPHLQELRTSS